MSDALLWGIMGGLMVTSPGWVALLMGLFFLWKDSR